MIMGRQVLKRVSKFWFTSVMSALILVACGGGGNNPQPDPEPTPTPTFTVDEDVQPATPTVAGIDGGSPRPLGSVTDEKGNKADFVLNELAIATTDRAKLDAFLARWNGEILFEVDFSDAGIPDIANIYLVGVDVSAADPAGLSADLDALDPDSRGKHRVSSEEGLELFAAAASEAEDRDLAVAVNWVLYGDQELSPQDIPGGVTTEAPSGDSGYTTNPFTWPYMNRGSPQDIGVGDAWRVLAAADKLDNKVKIMVMDGGFSETTDMPTDRVIRGASSWEVPNPAACSGGSSCPWHGTSVATAAMGIADNNFGAAGPAGPVGRLVAVQSPGDVIGFFRYMASTLSSLVSEQARIINISAGVRVPAALAVLANPIVDPITRSLELAGFLIFASAGNEGDNVDAEDCFFVCWEEATWIPCESSGVKCVGGMETNSPAKAPNSNYGSKTSGDTVDIYGPYRVWTGADPANTGNTARLTSGTSFSSPFVAGVAAIVWAADPGLSAGEVWEIVRDTAHVGGVHGDGGHQRRVNALAAVTRALGDVPPLVRITAPADPTNVQLNASTFFEAEVEDLDGTGCCTVTWTSNVDGDLGTSTRMTHAFTTMGSRTVTVTARDSDGNTGSASITIDVVTTPPTVTIIQPLAGTDINRGEPYLFRATSRDPNEPGSVLPCANLTWTSSVASDPFPATGCEVLVTFASNGARTVTLTGTDSQSETGQDTVAITVVEPPDTRPDLVATLIEQTGPATLEGDNPTVPVRVTIQNQGSASASTFKVSTFFTGSSSSPTTEFFVSFTRDGSTVFTTAPLAAGASTTLEGIVTFISSNSGNTVSITALADSCAGEEFQPVFCRVDESNEFNNQSSAITVTLP